jgi:polyhydroxyalkanoate synthesis regulator phasin
MKRSLSLVLSLCFLFLLSGISKAEDITNPILKKLVEKGILTEQEALSVMHDMERETAEKDKRVEQKIEQKVTEAAPMENKDLDKIAKALKGFKIGGLWYLSYQNGEGADVGGTAGDDVDRNKFAAKRGYLTVEKEIAPWFQARITTDVTTVKDATSNLDGSLTLKIKYLYGKFIAPDIAFLTKPNLEVGVVHIPWLDYEENLNYYRMQDTMFLERNGIFNSADIGVTFTSLLGGYVSEDYQKNVNSAYPGRYGSIQGGVYNGGGYAASEKNKNKVLEGRLTVRPLPDIIPGLQFSYFGITGKGNTSAKPDWKANLAFASFEHEYVVLTGQYFWGKGRQDGADENNKKGYSFFTELKLYDMFKDPVNRFSIIGRYDHFDPNKDVKNDDNNRYIAGVAYYLDKPHKNMVLLDYDTVDYKKPGLSKDNRVQLTLQVAF